MTDPDLPRHRPICPVCERPFPREPSRHLKMLQRRLDYLRAQAAREGRTDTSWIRAEIAALEWAITELGAR